VERCCSNNSWLVVPTGATPKRTQPKPSSITTPVAGTSTPAPTSTKKSASKPKRVKRKELPVRRVQQVPLDDHGNIILPVQIGILTVYSLGRIEHERDNFHNDRYIWPVGYQISRPYFSMRDPNAQTIYTCRISDGGDGPRVSLFFACSRLLLNSIPCLVPRRSRRRTRPTDCGEHPNRGMDKCDSCGECHPQARPLQLSKRTRLLWLLTSHSGKADSRPAECRQVQELSLAEV
jgi:hypothetical protein